MAGKVCGVVLAVLFSSIPALAWAQTGATFYKGRETHLLVGAAAGGGYDLYARFYARHLPTFLPGIRVVVENLPTAGGLAMENTLFNQSIDRKSTRLNSSHTDISRMPSSA